MCSISQFLNCTDFTSDGRVAEVESGVQCHCPDNCTIISHSVELSSGEISGLISDRLLDTHWTELERDFAMALETRHRIDEDEMLTTANLLHGTVTSLHDMVRFMNEKFTSYRTHGGRIIFIPVN